MFTKANFHSCQSVIRGQLSLKINPESASAPYHKIFFAIPTDLVRLPQKSIDFP